MEQQYAVPSALGTTYVITDNPPAGAHLVQGEQYQSINQPSLEQRLEVLEKEVSDINNKLGIKTNSGSVNLDDASKLLEQIDSSASDKATNDIANNGVNNAATAIAAPTDSSGSASSSVAPTIPSSSATAPAIPTTPSSVAPTIPSSSAAAPIPSADDIAKQLGDLSQ